SEPSTHTYRLFIFLKNCCISSEEVRIIQSFLSPSRTLFAEAVRRVSPNNKALIRRTRKLLPDPLSTTPALRFRLRCSEEVRILQSFKTLSSICFQQKTAQKQNRSTQIPDHIRNPFTASALRCRLCCSEEAELYTAIKWRQYLNEK
ncbi:hypothetical protein, partial [Zoogloea dura]|uniref:hypothetical protein n=1 Tax=Zoogloea dura TaxID=2728840 RepID=UPI00197FF2A6